MRLCRFDEGRHGVVVGDTVHDVTATVERVSGAGPVVRGDPVIARLAEVVKAIGDPKSHPARPLSSVKLLSPVKSPSKLVCAPVNYRAHIAEMQADTTIVKSPLGTDIMKAGLFLKANSALVGASSGVAIRFPERRNDHECEFIVVIGREGSDIPLARALDHIGAYTLGLDMTLRGPEERSFRKSIDTYAVLGPWLVTADEIKDSANVSFSLKVNGEVRQNANTSDLILKIPEIISFASSFYTLLPGDVIYTGSPQGVGPVKPGDVMLAECAAIGSMEVKVRAHAP
jgi:2,4-didehydro-3-deoxy-L-rhamnonate hydrolase